MMVDVAAIFDEVFGPDDPDKGLSEKRCARCVGVPAGNNPLKNMDTSGTPSEESGHTLKNGVPDESERCAREVVEKQELTAKVTKAHRAHLKTNNPLRRIDPDAFDERAAIIEHDGGLSRQEAETLAAREQGFEDADSLHGCAVGRWAVEIERLANLPAVSPEGTQALKRAQAFISDGWALQAARLGWDAVELFGVCPRAPWRRLDRKGTAFGGVVQAVTQEAIAYVGGLRRYRTQVNNDGGAVPIWEMAQEAPS